MLSSKLLWLHPVKRKNKPEEEKKKKKAERVHLWVILALNTKSFISPEICGYL